jgi:hypothetical protein
MKMLLKSLRALPAPEFTPARYDNSQDYLKTSASYQGILRKHPYKDDTVILISPPFVQSALCYEFKIANITRVEELPNLVTEKGENIGMVNLWVRKGSYGLVMQAFEVQTEATPPRMEA